MITNFSVTSQVFQPLLVSQVDLIISQFLHRYQLLNQVCHLVIQMMQADLQIFRRMKQFNQVSRMANLLSHTITSQGHQMQSILRYTDSPVQMQDSIIIIMHRATGFLPVLDLGVLSPLVLHQEDQIVSIQLVLNLFVMNLILLILLTFLRHWHHQMCPLIF